MRRRRLMLVPALAAALTVGACGGGEKEEPAKPQVLTVTAKTPAPEPVADPVPEPEATTAYDVEFREGIEKEIRGKMREVVRDADMTASRVIARCAAESERTFSCTGTVDARLLEPESGTYYCSTVTNSAKGTVNPDGSYDWAAEVDKTEQTDPVEC